MQYASQRCWRWLPVMLVLATSWSSWAQQANAPAGDAVSRVNGNSLRRVKIVPAPYPQAAREQRLEGFVELDFTLQPDGSVSDIQVLNSKPLGVFEASAIQALSQWLYEPVLRDGKPLAVRSAIRIKFAL